jgi:hypothetical protein
LSGRGSAEAELRFGASIFIYLFLKIAFPFLSLVAFFLNGSLVAFARRDEEVYARGLSRVNTEQGSGRMPHTHGVDPVHGPLYHTERYHEAVATDSWL